MNALCNGFTRGRGAAAAAAKANVLFIAEGRQPERIEEAQP
jgi:cobalamin biosynthesis protein CbiD